MIATGPTLTARNGEGGRYCTGGEIRRAVLTENGAPANAPPTELGDDPLIELKNAVWQAVNGWLAPGP